jgi:hypothetical protein
VDKARGPGPVETLCHEDRSSKLPGSTRISTQVRPFCNHKLLVKLVQTVAYEPIWLQPNSLTYISTMP